MWPKSATEANLSRRALSLPSQGRSPPFCNIFQDVASEGRLPCAAILDCGITEAEWKQILHGEPFCFQGPFAAILQRCGFRGRFAVCRYSGLRHNGSGTEANLSRRAILLPRAVRCHFATYFKMLLPKAVCHGYSGLRHNGSGTEANLSRRAMLLPRAIRRHFANYLMMLLPRAVCRVPLFWTAA